MDRIARPLQMLSGETVLIVASTGGHLEQAVRWHQRLQFAQDSEFVTFRSPQSRSLLAAYPTTYIPYIAPRDFRAGALAVPAIVRRIRRTRPTAVLSTGAGVAFAAYVASLITRIPMYFIESVSRFHGPSATGRALARAPRIRTFTQHALYASDRWQLVPSLLESYRLVGGRQREPVNRPWRIFVTLGTIRPYRFDSLVDQVLQTLRPGDEVTWQLGATTRTQLPGVAHELLDSEEFDRFAVDADIVITHAGVGSILRLLDLGVSPIVVPRRRARGEHVDDHQLQAAGEIQDLGLIDSVDATALHGDLVHTPRASVEYASNSESADR